MDLRDFIISEDVSIFEAASVIDKNAQQIAFLCREGALVAALSDGDIRRHILNNGDFSIPIKEIANYQPKYLMSAQQAESPRFLRQHQLKAVPILNDLHEIVSIEFADSVRVRKASQLHVPLAIMAGGKGTRLAPYTDVLPKPLIPIGDKTITEHIIDRFLSFGCKDVYMIINYKKELIKAFFKEADSPAHICFIEEQGYLGTGGGLRLLEGHVKETFFLSNCDILVDADYEDILRFHKSNGHTLTMVCAMKKIIVPYGTVQLDEAGRISSIVEKPEYPLLTNTGLYVIEPEFLEHLAADKYTDITDAIQELIGKQKSVGVYPVSENAWMDMGEMKELSRMQCLLEKQENI